MFQEFYGFRTMPFSRLLQDFFRIHLVARRNLNQHTVRAYRDTLVLLLHFAAAKAARNVTALDLNCLDSLTILAFLENLESNRGNAIRTRNARLAAIRSFFRYVAAEDPASAALCQAVLGIPVKRSVKPAVVCQAREEIASLLNTPDCSRPDGRRDAAILWFL